MKDAKTIGGLIPLYQKENTLYAELSNSQYGDEFIVLIAIARGIGRNPLYGGMTWGYGDDWVWTFKKIDERVHVIRKNVRFKADSGSPEATAMKYAYTDSVLFSLPILTKGPKGGDLVDLTSIFMSDLPQISQVLPGAVFSSSKSSWAAIKGFPDNVELEVAATYASSGRMNLDSVADSRGITINVHYSISKLKSTGYKPRLADDRVGYFLTVLKDYSKNGKADRFVRYINRWHLEPADPGAELSPPKKPIVFWMEKTIPFKHRAAVRDGILEWNKAFEKAGYVNAIEVRQQPDDADWDPEDINYNTFRWITSSAGFAMGPSRVNPHTGQILDADIIFDADFLQYWKQEYETFTPSTVTELTGGAVDIETYRQELAELPRGVQTLLSGCVLQQTIGHQFAFGQAVIAAAGATDAQWQKDLERLHMQGLKGTVMHEVGHTLGLRHNFKGSTMLSLEEMNDTDATSQTGLIASVMDYDAVNLVAGDATQGDFFTTTLGPYDHWAIEYGYKPLKGGTNGEVAELEKIAARSGAPELAYATDEDTRGIDPDPYSNRYDLGDDPIEFAKQRAELVKQLLPTVVENMTQDGDDYSQARRAFNVLLGTHGRAMFFVSRFIGGLEISRSHKGDKDGPSPVTVIAADKQREALDMLSEQVFSDEPYMVPPEVYSYLMPSRWSHWGVSSPYRTEFAVHDVVQMWQARVLDKLLSPLTLERLQDAELRTAANDDCFTSVELMERLTDDIFHELGNLDGKKFTNRKPAISSLRRNLQRDYMKRMANLALGRVPSAPEDCQTIAYYELKELGKSIDAVLASDTELDTYSRAHLEETSSRIAKVLESRVTQMTP